MLCGECKSWGKQKAMIKGNYYCGITHFSTAADEKCRMEWQIEKRDEINKREGGLKNDEG